jgi:hypothetical protein
VVWIKLHGGLVVGRAEVKLAWVGEFSDIREIRRRTGGAAIQRMGSFWQGRPRVGYAVVAELMNERWIEPVWQGPRTYAYEWVVLDDKKRAGWLQEKAPPRDGSELLKKFLQWRKNAG